MSEDNKTQNADPFKLLNALTGGRVNYYLVPVPHPQRETQRPYQAECEDIIEALELNPDEANIFKEIWRSARARQDLGKPGHTALYGAEKINHYAGRILRRLRRLHDEEQLQQMRAATRAAFTNATISPGSTGAAIPDSYGPHSDECTCLECYPPPTGKHMK